MQNPIELCSTIFKFGFRTNLCSIIYVIYVPSFCCPEEMPEKQIFFNVFLAHWKIMRTFATVFLQKHMTINVVCRS